MAAPTLLEIDATQQTLEITSSRDAVSIQGRSIETGTPTDGEVMTYSTSSSEWIYQTITENVDDRVAALIQDSAGGGLTWTYDDSAGTLTPAYVGDSTLVTSGALNSGSITSGFTSIDVGSGAITTTGTVSATTLAGTLSTAAQTNITSIGTLAAGAVPASLVTAGTFGAGAYVFPSTLAVTGDASILNGSGLVVGHTALIAFADATPELQVVGGSGASDSAVGIGNWAANANGAALKLYKSRNATIGSNTAVTTGDSLGEIQAYGDDGSDAATASSAIIFDTEGTIATGQVPGVIRFQVAAAGTLADAVTISSAKAVACLGALAVTGTITGSTSLALASGATVTGIDDGSLGSSATLLATQGAIKTYVDAQVTAQDLDIISDSGNIDIDLDSESLTLAGGTGLASSASSTTVTFAIDSTVATLSGSQTLTNKSIAGSANTLSAIANSSLTNSTVAYGGVSLSLGGADTTPAFNLSDATAYTGDSSLVTVGTIASGTWNGSVITGAYIDATSSPLASTKIWIGSGSNVAAEFALSGNATMTAGGVVTVSTAAACTGNAATATALQTARTIGGTSFDGTANIAVALSATTTALASARTIGGTSFDGTANIAVALSATATALATARAINGTDFDGTAAITVTAAAGTLTGATLNSGVTASSLTSLGTIGSLVATSADINAGTFDGIVGGTTPADGSFSTLSASSTVSIGSNPSSTGAVRYANNSDINVRNAANNADIRAWVINSSDQMVIGASGVANYSFAGSGATALGGTLAVTGTSAFTGNVGIGQSAGSYALAVTEATAGVDAVLVTHSHATSPGGVVVDFSAKTGDRTWAYFTGLDQGNVALVNLWSDGGATFTGALQVDTAIYRTTTDGSDNSVIEMCGGGSNAVSRGALIALYGNEHASDPGDLYLNSGGVAGGDIIFRTHNGSGSVTERMRIVDTGAVSVAGNLTMGATNAQLYIGATSGQINLIGARSFAIQSTALSKFKISDDTAGATRLELNLSGNWNFQSGNINTDGVITKGSGSFKIAHPLPAKTDTHHLVHSFHEGPRADLSYRGEVALESGSATVNLDDSAGMTEGTWELLCRDPQCWIQNDSGWDAVRGSVEGNTLTIECAEASSGDTVSWMVVAERCDSHMYDTGWTDADGRVIVEPEKEEEE